MYSIFNFVEEYIDGGISGGIWEVEDAIDNGGRRGRFLLLEVQCCVIVSWLLSYFYYTNVTETVSTVANLGIFVMFIWPLNVLCKASSFTFLVPYVARYLHDLHAEKNTLLHNSAVW